MTNIITSLLLLFLGDLLVLALTIFLIGFMFLLRVMLNVWFDTDFFKSIVAWFKKADDKLKAKQMEMEKSEKTLYIIEGDEDVSKQK